MLLFCSAELWAKNDYESCSLPPVDNDDDDTQDDNDDDDEKMTDIGYVIGNVLEPQNTDNTDAIIVHCVGNQLLIMLTPLIQLPVSNNRSSLELPRRCLNGKLWVAGARYLTPSQQRQSTDIVM